MLSFTLISFNIYIFISYFFFYYYDTSSYQSLLCFRIFIAKLLLKERAYFALIFITILFPIIQVFFTLSFHYHIISHNLNLFYFTFSLLCHFLKFNFTSISFLYCYVISYNPMFFTLTSPLPCHFKLCESLLFWHSYYYINFIASISFTLTSLLSYHLQLKYLLFYYIYCQIILSYISFLYLLNSIAMITNLANYYFCYNFQYH